MVVMVVVVVVVVLCGDKVGDIGIGLSTCRVTLGTKPSTSCSESDYTVWIPRTPSENFTAFL